MPKVQEYLPEVDAQGPVGQLSPMLEQVSMYGRGLETFGRDVGDAATKLRERQTQEETSNAYADVAEQRAQFTERVQQETNEGTLDVNKVKDDYQKWVDKTYDSYDTPGGKNAFVRASARAGGAILVNAARGQAIVAGNKAKDNLTTLMNTNSNLVANDPMQFADLRESQVDAIQSQVEAGALSQPVARQIQTAMDLELAKSAVRGHMQSDYNNIKASVISSGDKVDPNTDSLNTARVMLDKGGFDQFLDSDKKKELYQEIRQNQVAAQVAGKQFLSQKQTAIDAQGEKFKVDSFAKLQTNGLDPEEVTKAARAGLISANEQLQMYHLIREAGKEQQTSNPALRNSITQRVLSPDNAPGHISDPMQIAPMVKEGMLSMDDFHQISKAIQMVLSNRVNSFNEGKLIEQAKTRIGQSDPQAEYKLMLFTNEIQQAKQSAMANQQPVGPLLDPHSPQYLGKQIDKYLASPAQVLSDRADQIRGQAVAPAPIQTKPGVIPNAAPNNTAVAPEDIAKMDLGGLQKLDPKKLSPAQKATAAARWRQLKKGNP